MRASLPDDFLVRRQLLDTDTPRQLHLAPTSDGEGLVAAFVVFIAQISRSSRFDLLYVDAARPGGSGVLQIDLDPFAAVVAQKQSVARALVHTRATLDARPPAARLPVGITRVTRLDQLAPTARLLTLVLAHSGAACWRFDPSVLPYPDMRLLAARFARFRATSANELRRFPMAPPTTRAPKH